MSTETEQAIKSLYMPKVFKGREKVIMPISKELFMKDPLIALRKYLNQTIGIFNANVSDIETLHEYYLGNQSIFSKLRKDESLINNKVVENHIYKQVNFKVGFMYGNPLEYTITNEKKIDTDDMTYLNSYLNDVNKASLDIEKAQDLYEFGVAYQRLIPRRQKLSEYDIESEAPFELVNMPVKQTCVVYSNDIPNEPLFGMVISDDRNTENYKSFKTVQIYMPYRRIVYKNNIFVQPIEDIPQPYSYIPIQEFCLNKDRIGIIEIGVQLQNLINNIDSSQMDGIEEEINSFIVMINQRVDEDFMNLIKTLKRERVLVLNTQNPQTPADLKLVSTKLDQGSTNQFYERVLKALYDIVAVPQASGNVTSGGDTGQARLLGNGWESAQNQAQVDQQYLIKYERELLKNIIKICKLTEKCPVNEINASDVAIKFNINMSNNLLVKAEALKMLNEALVPEKAILSICGITKDVDGLGDDWKKNKQNQAQIEQQNNNQGINS